MPNFDQFLTLLVAVQPTGQNAIPSSLSMTHTVSSQLLTRQIVHVVEEQLWCVLALASPIEGMHSVVGLITSVYVVPQSHVSWSYQLPMSQPKTLSVAYHRGTPAHASRSGRLFPTTIACFPRYKHDANRVGVHGITITQGFCYTLVGRLDAIVAYYLSLALHVASDR
jgi:hypothetical protein